MDLLEEIAKRGSKASQYLLEYGNLNIHPDKPLREAALHYLQGGGKGFRPAMLQLVCGALGGDESLAIAPAAAIEALHVSSLIHDDFMDNDTTRRGLEAVWAKWDPTIAVLAGDVLFGVSFSIVGSVDGLSDSLKYGFTKELAQIYTKLCEGQMQDIGFETTPFANLTESDITKMQYLKTGVLFEFSCITGARIALSKMEDPLIEKIRQFAKLSGTAFQIQDDVIGILGESEKTGKPVGSDIISGKRTLIAIHAISNATDKQKEVIMAALGNSKATKEEIKSCIETMNVIGSIEHSRATAKTMAEKAKAITKDLPDNEQTQLLSEFATYMVERNI